MEDEEEEVGAAEGHDDEDEFEEEDESGDEDEEDSEEEGHGKTRRLNMSQFQAVIDSTGALVSLKKDGSIRSKRLNVSMFAHLNAIDRPCSRWGSSRAGSFCTTSCWVPPARW